MKKIICLVLSFALAFSFAACGKKDSDTKKSEVDLEYYAKNGDIPECDYYIGDDIEKIKTELSAKADEEPEEGSHSTVMYEFVEEDDYSFVNSGDFRYYYRNGKEKDGVSLISALNGGFGFELGDVDVDIKEKLAGYEYEELELTEENTFFIYGMPPEGKVYKYEFKKNSVLLLFYQNSLCAVALYNNKDWEF